MRIFNKQALVLCLLKVARKWTLYGFVDDLIVNAIKEQEKWMQYTED